MLEDSEIGVAADRLMPKGQKLSAAIAEQIDAGTANESLPKGQSDRAALASSQIVEGAKRSAPQGQPDRALLDEQIDAGAAMDRLPKGPLANTAPASSQIVEGMGHDHVAERPVAVSPLDDLCGRLMALQRDRILAIRMQSRCDRTVEAYIRNRLGFTTDEARMSKDTRKKMSAKAKRIKEAVEQGKALEKNADEAMRLLALSCSAVILRSMSARQMWDDMRDDTVKEMRVLAKQLPAWEFISSVRGVSDLGLAVIVGEAGNLGDYPKKGHLWKRLGLAVIKGRRQGNPEPNATAEDWIEHGYKARRRAEVYAFLDDKMFLAQWRGAKDEQPAYPIGLYGEHYGRKKAEYLIRFADEPNAKDHAENAARRYMAKMFIRDLWKAWRGVCAELPKGQDDSAPATLAQAAE